MQPSPQRRIGYRDSYFPDGAIKRTYSNGIVEKRVLVAPGRIQWLDNNRQEGFDVDMGNGLVKREYANGQVAYGQNVGNGITSWNNGAYVTVNETPFPTAPVPYQPPAPSGFAAWAIGAGLGGFFGLSAMNYGPYGVPYDSDEYMLYAELEQEELLRRQQQQGGGDGGTSSDGGYYEDTSTDSFG
jgi:hypothetical protein